MAVVDGSGAVDQAPPGGRRPPPRPCRRRADRPPVVSVDVDPTTLDAFRRKDPEAVRALYRDYGRLVYAVAHRVLGQHELAEEAAQQTFVRAWQAADRIDLDRDPAPWLATIARNVAIDIHRREARRPTTPLTESSEGDPAMATPAPDIERLDAVWRVRSAIEALPGDEATVVRLQHLEGLTHIEIADRLGIAVGTVKSRSHRAHHRLASVLGHLREGFHV